MAGPHSEYEGEVVNADAWFAGVVVSMEVVVLARETMSIARANHQSHYQKRADLEWVQIEVDGRPEKQHWANPVASVAGLTR